MISWLAEGLLVIALGVTAWRMAVIHRELRTVRVLHGEYRVAFARTTEALTIVRAALKSINEDGRQTLEALTDRIDEARRLTATLDRACVANASVAPPPTIGAALFGRTGLAARHSAEAAR